MRPWRPHSQLGHVMRHSRILGSAFALALCALALASSWTAPAALAQDPNALFAVDSERVGCNSQQAFWTYGGMAHPPAELPPLQPLARFIHTHNGF